MFQVISEKPGIKKYQKLLEATIKKSFNKKGVHTIGFLGGNMTCEVWANNQIWYATFEVTKKDESTPRFWNAFGLSKQLANTRSNNISVEMNIPSSGINRTVAGIFAVNSKSGEICLLHRGKIGGGRKGIGKEAFLSWYPAEPVEIIEDNKKKSKALLIGSLKSKSFLNQLSAFVSNVAKFREIATSGEIDAATFLSDEELKKKAEESKKKKPNKIKTQSTIFDRNPYISEFAKRRANGDCQLCKLPAPFKNKSEKPFLETHHIKWLSDGGKDTIDNTVALCPNCHRKMHILNIKQDKIKLVNVATKS